MRQPKNRLVNFSIMKFKHKWMKSLLIDFVLIMHRTQIDTFTQWDIFVNNLFLFD